MQPAIKGGLGELVLEPPQPRCAAAAGPRVAAGQERQPGRIRTRKVDNAIMVSPEISLRPSLSGSVLEDVFAATAIHLVDGSSNPLISSSP